MTNTDDREIEIDVPGEITSIHIEIFLKCSSQASCSFERIVPRSTSINHCSIHLYVLDITILFSLWSYLLLSSGVIALMLRSIGWIKTSVMWVVCLRYEILSFVGNFETIREIGHLGLRSVSGSRSFMSTAFHGQRSKMRMASPFDRPSLVAISSLVKICRQSLTMTNNFVNPFSLLILNTPY